MKTPRYKPVTHEKLRITVGIISFLLIIPVVITVIQMLSYNIYYDRELSFTEISAERLDDLRIDERIDCMVDEENFLAFKAERVDSSSEPVGYTSVLTPEGNVLFILIKGDDAPAIMADAYYVSDDGNAEFFRFQGTVKLNDYTLPSFKENALNPDVIKKYKITEDKLLPYYVECHEYNSKFADRYVIIDIISIPLLIAIGIFLLLPTIHNLRYLSGVKKGKIIPHKAVRRRDVLNFYGGDYTDLTQDPADSGEELPDRSIENPRADNATDSIYDPLKPYTGYDEDNGDGSGQ